MSAAKEMAAVALETLGRQTSRLLERQERHVRYDRLRRDVDRLREAGPQAPA